MPMKRVASVSTERNKRPRRNFDLSSFRYQPKQQPLLSIEPCPKESDPGNCSLTATKGSQDSPIDLVTRSNSTTPCFGPHRSFSMSSSPLSSLGSWTADTSLDAIDELLAAADTRSVGEDGPANSTKVLSLPTLTNGGRRNRLVVRFKLHSAFPARYPARATEAGRRNTGDWVQGPAHVSETQIPWVDLVREVFADSESGIMTHHEV